MMMMMIGKDSSMRTAGKYHGETIIAERSQNEGVDDTARLH